MSSFRRMVREQEAAQQQDEEIMLLTESTRTRVRNFGAVNWIGLGSLFHKEVHRFSDAFMQTIIAPLIMNLLFLIIFAIALGGKDKMIGPVHYIDFLIPGILMMSMAQNAFVGVSASLILQKIQGSIVDLLMPPLSPGELTIGFVGSGIVRGVMVGVVSLAAIVLLNPMPFFDPGFIVYYTLMGTMMLSMLGLITGIVSTKFDHLSAVQNFIILPATFLSGTFFSLSHLPQEWSFICTLNPFFYLIDGFRYGFTGYAEGNLLAGGALLLLINIALFNICYWMFARGTCLKP